MKIGRKSRTRAGSRKNRRNFINRIRQRTSKGSKFKPKGPDMVSINSTVIKADNSYAFTPADGVLNFYQTATKFAQKRKLRREGHSTPFKYENKNNKSYNYSNTSTKRSLKGESSASKVSSSQSRERFVNSKCKSKSVLLMREKTRESINRLLLPARSPSELELTSQDTEIIDSQNFSNQLENIFINHKITDYMHFDYISHCDENYGFKSYFQAEYSHEEVDGLLKIHTYFEHSAGHVLKEKDLPFIPVVLVISGKIGVYHYPKGKKTLLRVLQSKEIIGDYELNFITSRSAQYEVISKAELLRFP
ncbi:unnamed protein product [Moneuplotes crassus]|uniref:Uncharacterized protein n=1 Tax=Euplotes crassus TaxID=5936 RepID=A0AAD1U5W7_EUPCR|nr:unnamed protein product [Moneuplotes crassus]